MICIIMLDIIHQKKEHMIMKFLYDFFHKSIKTKQRIIALNNDGFVLLSEFQLMSIGLIHREQLCMQCAIFAIKLSKHFSLIFCKLIRVKRDIYEH